MSSKYDNGVKLRRTGRGNLPSETFNEVRNKICTIYNNGSGIQFLENEVDEVSETNSGYFTEEYLDENFEIFVEDVLTKDTLKSGMVLEFEGNEKYVLMKDTMYGDYLINANDCNTYFHLDNYNNNLIMKLKNLTLSNETGCFDFMEIYRVWTNVDVSVGYNCEHSEMIYRSDNLLWENPTIKPKEMSLADIEEELGYSIKIKETK